MWREEAGIQRLDPGLHGATLLHHHEVQTQQTMTHKEQKAECHFTVHHEQRRWLSRNYSVSTWDRFVVRVWSINGQ